MNSKLRQLTACLFILSLALAVLQTGCGYGKVSPRATEYAQAIYTTANLQKSEKIEPLRKQIQADVDPGKLPISDAKILNELLDNAAEEKWGKAMGGTRKLLQDQVLR